jgi:iron complex outermembrane receptor protein
MGPEFTKIDSSLNTVASSHQTYHNISVSLNDSYKIDTAGQSISADLDYSKFRNNVNANYITNYYLPDGSSQYAASYLGNVTPSIIDVRTAKADYVNPLTKSLKLESGLKFSDVL